MRYLSSLTCCVHMECVDIKGRVYTVCSCVCRHCGELCVCARACVVSELAPTSVNQQLMTASTWRGYVMKVL